MFICANCSRSIIKGYNCSICGAIYCLKCVDAKNYHCIQHCGKR